jgi:hypothetical protein
VVVFTTGSRGKTCEKIAIMIITITTTTTTLEIGYRRKFTALKVIYKPDCKTK